jgi:uncharacterized protein YbbK (DUF523 family)
MMDFRGSGPIRIGVSACLLGQEVRFDGGHKRNDFLTGTLGDFVEFVAVCPEVDIGLGIPRQSLRLVRDHSGAVRMMANKSGADLTDTMNAYAERRAAALERDDLSGYVLKKGSPSCGMERVRIYGRAGMPVRDGRGLFAEALIRRLPNLPVEEEGRLNDPSLRENFIERVFAYHRMRALFGARIRWTTGALVAFHTAHKLALMAHSPRAYTELGRLVADSKRIERAELRDRYSAQFMAALRKPDTDAPRQRDTTCSRLFARGLRCGFAPRVDGSDRGISARNRAAGGAADVDPSLGAALRHRLSKGSDLSRTASARVDAAQSRVRADW